MMTSPGGDLVRVFGFPSSAVGVTKENEGGGVETSRLTPGILTHVHPLTPSSPVRSRRTLLLVTTRVLCSLQVSSGKGSTPQPILGIGT